MKEPTKISDDARPPSKQLYEKADDVPVTLTFRGRTYKVNGPGALSLEEFRAQLHSDGEADQAADLASLEAAKKPQE